MALPNRIPAAKRWQPKQSVVRSNLPPVARRAQKIDLGQSSMEDALRTAYARVTQIAPLIGMSPDALMEQLVGVCGTDEAQQTWITMHR